MTFETRYSYLFDLEPESYYDIISTQTVGSWKHAALTRFLNILKPDRIYEFTDPVDLDFLKYLKLVDSKYWQIWKRICDQLHAGKKGSDALTELAAYAVAKSLTE